MPFFRNTLKQRKTKALLLTSIVAIVFWTVARTSQRGEFSFLPLCFWFVVWLLYFGVAWLGYREKRKKLNVKIGDFPITDKIRPYQHSN